MLSFRKQWFTFFTIFWHFFTFLFYPADPLRYKHIAIHTKFTITRKISVQYVLYTYILYLLLTFVILNFKMLLLSFQFCHFTFKFRYSNFNFCYLPCKCVLLICSNTFLITFLFSKTEFWMKVNNNVFMMSSKKACKLEFLVRNK